MALHATGFYSSPRDVRTNPRASLPQASNHDALVSHMSPRTQRRAVGGGDRIHNQSNGGASVRNQSQWLGGLRGSMQPRGFCAPGNKPRSPVRRPDFNSHEALVHSETPGQLSMSAMAMERIPGPEQEPLPDSYVPPPTHELPLDKFEYPEFVMPGPTAEQVAAKAAAAAEAERLDKEAATAVIQSSFREMQATQALQEHWDRAHLYQIQPRGPREPVDTSMYNAKGWKGAMGGWDQGDRDQEEEHSQSWYTHHPYGYRHSWERHYAPHHYGLYGRYGQAYSHGPGMALPPYTEPVDHNRGLGVRASEQQEAFQAYLAEKGQQ